MTSATRAIKDRQKVKPRGKLAARIAGFFDRRKEGNISVRDGVATSQYLAGIESQRKGRVAEALHEAAQMFSDARACTDEALGTYALKLADARTSRDALYLCEQIRAKVGSSVDKALSASEHAQTLALVEQQCLDIVSATYLRAARLDATASATATCAVSKAAEELAAQAMALRADYEKAFSRHLHLNDRP